jgi:hypothetical protein
MKNLGLNVLFALLVIVLVVASNSRAEPITIDLHGWAYHHASPYYPISSFWIDDEGVMHWRLFEFHWAWDHDLENVAYGWMSADIHPTEGGSIHFTVFHWLIPQTIFDDEAEPDEYFNFVGNANGDVLNTNWGFMHVTFLFHDENFPGRKIEGAAHGEFWADPEYGDAFRIGYDFGDHIIYNATYFDPRPDKGEMPGHESVTWGRVKALYR